MSSVASDSLICSSTESVSSVAMVSPAFTSSPFLTSTDSIFTPVTSEAIVCSLIASTVPVKLWYV